MKAGKLLNTRLFLLLALFNLLGTVTLAQGSLILMSGESMNFNEIKIIKDSVEIYSGDDVMVLKSESILVAIPDKEAPFTFHYAKNKKTNIKKKDIEYGYSKTDFAKILAYRFYKTDVTGDDAYKYNPISDISPEEFSVVFDEMQKTLKKRTIVGLAVAIPAATAALILGIVSFSDSLEDYQAVQ